jgi:hypothetical protein
LVPIFVRGTVQTWVAEKSHEEAYALQQMEISYIAAKVSRKLPE